MTRAELLSAMASIIQRTYIRPVNVPDLDEVQRILAAYAALPEEKGEDGLWRCEQCGESLDVKFPSTQWRWTGEIARWFGPNVQDQARMRGAQARPVREWLPMSQRPKEGQWILYYFEPFKKIYMGKYIEHGVDPHMHSVTGPFGFTTVDPEIPYWMPLPDAPNGVVDQEKGT